MVSWSGRVVIGSWSSQVVITSISAIYGLGGPNPHCITQQKGGAESTFLGELGAIKFQKYNLILIYKMKSSQKSYLLSRVKKKVVRLVV